AERIADLIDKIDDLRQRVRDAMESYGTSVSNRQARIINRLTILSAIFLPLTFLTGFFGMNFQWLIESIASFRVFLILGIGLFVATLVTTLALFRGRGWLDGDRRPSRANESSRVAGRRATRHPLPGGTAAAHPRLASRIPAGLLGARFPRRARRLGGHGTSGDGLFRQRGRATPHGTLHDRPARGCVRGAPPLTAGSPSGQAPPPR